MDQWFKDFIHNVVVHPMLPFLPSDIGTKLHDWNAIWVFGLNKYDEIELEKGNT